MLSVLKKSRFCPLRDLWQHSYREKVSEGLRSKMRMQEEASVIRSRIKRIQPRGPLGLFRLLSRYMLI